jgi:hypothetical protein
MSASYDIILGHNAMKELQVDLLYSENVSTRSDLSKKLKLIARLVASGHAHGFTKYTFKRNSLLLTKQKKNSLRNDASAKHSIKQQTFANAYLIICHHKKRRKQLYALLDKHRFLFNGTLGLLPTKPVHVKIKSNAKPFHGHAFSVPKAYESMIRNEVECLCHLNVLCRGNESKWAALSFGTPMKNGQI